MPFTASKNVVVAVVVLGIGAAIWWLLPGATSTTVDVKVPGALAGGGGRQGGVQRQLLAVSR
jgi:hypothetical protein